VWCATGHDHMITPSELFTIGPMLKLSFTRAWLGVHYPGLAMPRGHFHSVTPP
jgi:hypothetical protein